MPLSDFGADWPTFIAAWWPNSPLQLPADDAWTALQVAERLWPEQVEQELNSVVRSSLVLGRLLNLGATLQRCEALHGFESVFERLRGGDSGALSELRFAARLLLLGYSPQLDPAIGDKRLDVAFPVGADTVLTEVISPQFSQYGRALSDQLTNLAETLKATRPHSSIDVFLTFDPNTELTTTLMQIATNYDSDRAVVMELENAAYVRITPFTSSATPFAPVVVDSHITLGVVAFEFGPARNTRVTVCIPFSDERAGRLVDAEGHHFPKDSFNLLVMDLSGIPNGLRHWVPLVARRLQPTINRRFGAVCLFQAEANATDPPWQSIIVENLYARQPLPQVLLRQLGGDLEM